MTRMPAWNGSNNSTGWQTPSLINSWANFDNTGATVATAAYRLDGSVVRLRGTVKSGATGFSIFIVPAGFRPLMKGQWLVPTNAGTGRLDVYPTGEVILAVIHSGTNAAVSIDAISFIAEQ